MKKAITLKLSDVDLNKLNKLAEQRGTTKSNIVREALAEYLSEIEVKSKNSFTDIASDLAGIVDGPKDLSVNKKYLSGYGS
ncbi:hypothetical protein MNBD_IGNAVI01-1006 [hydrothermal vent metagenome]|uniref:Ribbon-helix-helix protein CopG domain-containing protein n=1 Tax=hydrothermal vent metagenome TaxID=652676 RepID=A0A3B1CC88_9ZZZZ